MMHRAHLALRFAIVGLLAVACAFSGVAPAGAKRPGASSSAQVPPGPQPPFYPDFFGVSAGAEITKLPDAKFDREMNLMHHIGVHWLRAVFPWALVQSQDADPDDEEWAYVDRLVNFANALGMQIDAIVDNAPAWAQVTPTHVDCTNQPNFDINAYANFAAEVAARYPTSLVSAIELENAPNLPGTWTVPDACDYTRLMQASYPAIKAANPTVTVLTGGLGAQNAIRKGVQTIAGETFFSQMYDFGAQGYFDALSWHPYSYPCTPSQSCSQNRPWYKTPIVRQLMVDHGDGSKQIWATEFGSPTNGTSTDGHVTEDQQSSIMVDGMTSWVALPYAGPMFQFSFRDSGTDPTKKDNWFGLISNDFSHKKVAYYTYRQMALGLRSP
jgi:polysaccharide biosynthesis protein PslG